MSSNLTQIKAFLGKYYPELLQSTLREKYAKLNLGKFFEQKFSIQTNKLQIIIDPVLPGLTMIISGNEIHISKKLYDHEFVEITNSIENPGATKTNPKSLYNPDTFSTIAYLICQNHTALHIVGNIDEPIYIKYKCDFESFYNAVIIVNVAEGIDVEIVEEFESSCAINTVVNYVLQENATANVSTFYHNALSAMSFCLRNVIIKASAKYSHMLFGRGSSNVVDETHIQAGVAASVELLGCVNPAQQKFHTIVAVTPASTDYSFLLDHRHVVQGNGVATFTPVIIGHLPADSHTNISSIDPSKINESERAAKVTEFLKPIVERATLDRIVGSERFYNIKSKFVHF